MEQSATRPVDSGRSKYFNAQAESHRRTRDRYADKIAGIKSQFPGGVVTERSFATLLADYERRRAAAHREMMRALHNAGRQ